MRKRRRNHFISVVRMTQKSTRIDDHRFFIISSKECFLVSIRYMLKPLVVFHIPNLIN
jgi:hypothetical protein